VSESLFNAVNSIEGFPLSPVQRRYWLLHGEDLEACCTWGIFRWRGGVEAERLRTAIAEAVGRHEILRTCYRSLPGLEMPIQVIAEMRDFSWQKVELNASGEGERREVLADLLREERRAAFDLGTGPPLRVVLAVSPDPSAHLILVLPALAADRRSLSNLVAEIVRIYRGEAGAADEIAQYVDVSEWQNELLESDEGRAGAEFWSERVVPGFLSARPPLTKGGEGAGAFRPVSIESRLPDRLARRLEVGARELGSAPSTLLLGTWQLLLRRLTGSAETVVGTFAEGRRVAQLRDALGLYGQYLPIPLRISDDFAFAEVVGLLGELWGTALEKQETFSWEHYARAAAPDGGQVFFPFLFEFHESGEEPSTGEKQVLAERCGATLERFGARLSVLRESGRYALEWHWDSAVYDEAEIRRLAERFETLLGAALDGGAAPIAELEILGPAEWALLEGWGSVALEVPEAPSLAELFEAQVERLPADAPALVWDGGRLSFRELNARANRWARRLRSLGVGPESRVALLLERSPEQIVALLAIWKSGAAYLPFDPEQPRQRLARMLEDSGASIVLSREALRSALPTDQTPWLAVDSGGPQIDGESPENLGVEAGPHHLAYAIFTSGSTGRPKGVAIERRSVLNLLHALEEAVYAGLPAEPSVRVALNAPLSFDASVKQVIQVLRGRCLVLVPTEVRADGAAMLDWLERHRVDVLDGTPSQLRLLLGAGLADEHGPCFPRRVLVGGEAIDRGSWRSFSDDPARRFFNLYGPTECTVDTTVQPIAGELDRPSLGRPLGNVRVEVLGADARPLPVGSAGELCIGGAGLARGYLGKWRLTAERFIPAASSKAPGARLYRSGDRARWLADGRLEYLGRVDHQVKLRGVRVELGEIESVLAEGPGVGECAVVLRDPGHGDGRLVAYATPSLEAATERAERRHRLPNGLRVAVQDRIEADYVYQEIFDERTYLRHGISLSDGAVVFDVGANIGLFTLFVGSECEGATVYAFEPLAPIFETLRANARLAGADVRLFPWGLGRAETREAFTYYPQFSARSGLAAYADAGDEAEVIRRYVANQERQGVEGAGELLAQLGELLAGKFDAEEETCRLRRLSSVIAETGVEWIDLLKIDVQRAELDVLSGVDDEDWPKIGQLAIEVHDLPGAGGRNRVRQVVELLEARGFEVAAEQEEMLRGTDRYNVFARRAARAERIGGRPPRAAADEELYTLGNGLRIAHHNRNESDFIAQQIFEDQVYLAHGVELGPGAVVFDVGANIGLFALYAGLGWRGVEVHAFEPIPSSFEKLRRNTERYGLGAYLYPAGLSDKARTASFIFYPKWSASSSLYGDETADEAAARVFLLNRDTALEGYDLEGYDLADYADEILEDRFKGQEVVCQLTTLSTVIRERGVERIDLLKIDAEKSEWDILQGIEPADWPKIAQVVVEIHDLEARLAKTHELLAGHGFSVVVEQDELAVGTPIYNLYATRRSLEEMAEASNTSPPPWAGGALLALGDAGGEELSAAELREHLRRHLPDFMVPADVVVLENFPYTRHGKIDRAALPAPEEVEGAGEKDLLEPRTPTEEILVGIWEELLGLDGVDVRESFFELGGHSLLATQLMSRVRSAFQVELALRMLFEKPVLEELALEIESAIQEGQGLEAPPIRPVPRSGPKAAPIPLSFAQQRLWFLQQLTPDDPSYNSARALRLRGELSARVVEATLTEIVRRHEVLRTVFRQSEGGAVQEIRPVGEWRLWRVDLERLGEDRREAELRRLAAAEARRPFDLGRDLPLRVTLLRSGPGEHALFFTLHHVAADGWSLGVLVREIEAFYTAFSNGRPAPLPELPVQVADFAHWQREWLRGDVLERFLGFWRRRLGGELPTLKLPTDRAWRSDASHRGDQIHFQLTPELSTALAELGRQRGSTLFMTALAGFVALMARLAKDDDLIVGTAIAGRNRAETEGLIGFFINMLPLRFDLSGNPTLLELLDQVRAVSLGAYAHQDLPFDKMVEELQPERGAERAPIFQVAFGVQNAPSEILELPGLEAAPLGVASETARFDLTVWVSEGPEGLTVSWSYDTGLFETATIEGFEQKFETVLQTLVEEPHVRIASLRVVSESEQRAQRTRQEGRDAANLVKLRGMRRQKTGDAR